MKNNLVLILVAASVFTGFGIGLAFTPKPPKKEPKIKLTIIQNGLITFDIPLKITEKGTGIQFNIPLTNINSIGISKNEP